jgi:hypothetical protein
MSQSVTMLRVFIASPGDVMQERDLICQILQEWNDRHADEYGYVLQPRRWETHAIPELGDRPQAILNRQILDDCDILIGIFWTKLGTPTGEFDSGTVEEIERTAKQGKPVVLYFSEIPIIDVEANEYNRLKVFQAEIQTRGLYDSYHSHEELRDKVTRHIHAHIRWIRNGSAKERAEISPAIIQEPEQKPRLTMSYRTIRRHLNESGYCFRHDYELTVTLHNATTKNLREWHIDVQLPEILIDPKANPKATITRRLTSDQTNRILYPDDKEPFAISYTMNDAIYDNRSVLFPRHIRARAFVAGQLIDEHHEIVENMQNF